MRWALTLAVLFITPVACAGQAIGREAVERLQARELRFDPPEAVEHSVAGVPVLVLEDRALPLVTVYARFRGGYGLFEREWYAAGTALPSLLRYGGTTQLAPDSMDVLLEHYAIQTSFGGSGESLSSTMNVLTEHFDQALDLWGSLLADPGFDPGEIEVWRGRQLESIRRRTDSPTGLAFSEFNRLLYGDHPIGWEMEPDDLRPDLLTPERFGEIYQRVVCRENLILGLTGDVAWSDVHDRIEAWVSRLEPCRGELSESPAPDIRNEPGVYLIEKDIAQSVVVMAHPADVRLADDPAYFAATIGNSVLGGGGFSSRIMARVRTEEGFAYSASSLWTTPRRYSGLIGAITQTRPENTVPAIRAILETMEGLREAPPGEGEVRTAVDRIVNGFVFNFETPGQIVSRTMFYLAQDLPKDWLQRYLRGVRDVTARDIHRVIRAHLRPPDMMILIVGDGERIGITDLEALGPLTRLEVGGGS